MMILLKRLRCTATLNQNEIANLLRCHYSGHEILQEYWPWIQNTQGGNWGLICRQEMPLHWKRFNPWPHLEGDGHFHKNEENRCHSPWLSSVCVQVQTFREETQERISALLPMLLERKRGWCCDCWTVQTSCEDRQIQRAWAPAICQQGMPMITIHRETSLLHQTSILATDDLNGEGITPYICSLV